MGRVNAPVFIMLAVALALILSGCTSSSVGSAKEPIIVATVGAPTPVPTEYVMPSRSPIWVPSPTPKPALALSKINFSVSINGDRMPISGDPNGDMQLNLNNAVRRDTATFKITNLGGNALNGLIITYSLVAPMTMSFNGQVITYYQTQTVPNNVGTLAPGETRDVTIVSPQYSAISTVTVTISASWDGGSLDLYRTTLERGYSGELLINPPNEL